MMLVHCLSAVPDVFLRSQNQAAVIDPNKIAIKSSLITMVKMPTVADKKPNLLNNQEKEIPRIAIQNI